MPTLAKFMTFQSVIRILSIHSLQILWTLHYYYSVAENRDEHSNTKIIIAYFVVGMVVTCVMIFANIEVSEQLQLVHSSLFLCVSKEVVLLHHISLCEGYFRIIDYYYEMEQYAYNSPHIILFILELIMWYSRGRTVNDMSKFLESYRKLLERGVAAG